MLFLKEGEISEQRKKEKWRGTEGTVGLKRDISDGITTSVSTTACYCSAGAVWHPSISTLHVTHTHTHMCTQTQS